MLVRAARKSTRATILQTRISYDQLYLPWLCPAYNAALGGQRMSSNLSATIQTSGLRKRRDSKSGTSASRRSLATPASYQPSNETPLISSQYAESPSLPSTSSINLQHKPLVLDGSITPTAAKLKTDKDGIGGELADVLAVFDACLQVGRMQRAAVILKRVAKLDIFGQSNLIILHNRYLRAGVEQLIQHPSEFAEQALHTWFEMEIRSEGVPQDVETIAYMLKVSLQSQASSRRDRLIKRYMDMAEGDAVLEVFHLDILSAQEVNEINQVCPAYNLANNLSPAYSTLAQTNGPDVDPTVAKDEMFEKNGEVPFVRPTTQKGLGLRSLQRSLSLFSNRDASGLDLQALSHEERREAQKQIESDAIQSAVDRWREESNNLTKMGLNPAFQAKSIGARMWNWHQELNEYLKKELILVDEAEAKARRGHKDTQRCQYGPLLRYLSTEKLAAVTILSFMGILSSTGLDKGLSLASATLAIAKAVEDESLFELTFRKNKQDIWGNVNTGLSSTKEKERLSRAIKKRQSLHRGLGTAHMLPQPESNSTPNILAERGWTTTLKVKVGACLLAGLLDTAKISVTLENSETKEVATQMQPAFSHSHQFKMGKQVGVIIPNKSLVGLLKREPVHSLLSKQLPMLVEPDPWTGFSKGGYLSHPTKMLRVKLGDKSQKHYAEAAIASGDMDLVLKGLGILGKTSWRINHPVFDVMLEAWNSGEAIANLAPDELDIETPPEPSTSNDPLERRRWMRAVKLVENAKNATHSQRCFQNFQLEIARALRDDKFYFPHNVDFRGRAYPIPPYLNHMGADHCRGLLMFGEGKELGERGLVWLKIHLANVFGFDKASLSEREQFAMDHMADILDSASNPLKGQRWWLKAEDPWQCLASCFELKNAVESPDPAKFVSYLPVHQDGTCNGLQHYAALGGDVWGARQVNLEPSDRPADVYTAVADLVKESIAEDLKLGNPLAKALDGRITRKVVKQTVMTNVYGVTFVGAKAQVLKQIAAANPDLPNEEKSDVNHNALAGYTAKKIFAALSTMFRGAHDIQLWLGECAGRVCTSLSPEQISLLKSDASSKAPAPSKGGRGYKKVVDDPISFKSSVVWTTPLNLPVVQPYRKSKSKIVLTNLQGISLQEPDMNDAISKRKQLQGFPPNFIHSLDATHMLLSALQSDELGLHFAAVHDSFWSHASSIDTMNGVLRDAFVRIHSEDVIGRLAEEFSARYKDFMYLAKVKPGTSLYNKIASLQRQTKSNPREMTAKGFAGKRQLADLLLEKERLRLLSSGDPEEVTKGKAMVTPASIFEQMEAENDLAGQGSAVASLGATSEGAVPSNGAEDNNAGELTNEDSTLNTLSDEDSIEPPEQYENNDYEDNSDFGKQLSSERTKSLGRKYQREISLWLPLTFPAVPKKGEFNVSRLRDSQYFFS